MKQEPSPSAELREQRALRKRRAVCYAENGQKNNGISSTAKKVDAYDPTKLGFMSIPAEIRNLIYNSVLISPTPTTLEWLKTNTGLLRTCKAIRAEGSQVLYGRNAIAVPSMPSLLEWLEAISPASRACVRAVAVISAEDFSEAEREYWALRAYGGSSFERADQAEHRRVTRKVGRLLVDCAALESLDMQCCYWVDRSRPLTLARPGLGAPDAPWYEEHARYTAEILRRDFLPFFRDRLDRGQTPEALCGILRTGVAVDGGFLRPRTLIRLGGVHVISSEEIPEMKSVETHLSFLLARDIEKRQKLEARKKRRLTSLRFPNLSRPSNG